MREILAGNLGVMMGSGMVGLIGVGVGLAGSVFGAYLAVREMLARLDERHKAMEHRIERHSNRLSRVEDEILHKA